MILKDFVRQWRDAIPVGYFKPSTLANYNSHLKNNVLPYLGDREIESITALDIQKHIVTLQGKGLSAKSCRNAIMCMRVLWKSAIAWGLVTYSPFQGIMLPRVQTKEKVIFSLEEITRIIHAAPVPYNLFFWLAAETGMRAGELCGLRRCDVDFDHAQVSVRQSVWSGKVQLPKTRNSVRTISISHPLAEALRLFTVSRSCVDPDRVRFLFTTKRGYPWNPSDVVDRGLHPTLDALRLERGGLHRFRHSAASLANSENLDMKTRQQRLGHADARVTLDTYTHVGADTPAEREFVGKIGSVIAIGMEVN